jgi:aminopeptidase N
MKAHAYGNTVSDDLWKQVEKAAGKPVTAIAHDFTLQPGIPLIKVGEPACKGGNTTVTLTQEEFSRDHQDKKPLAWRVPVIAQIEGSGASGKTANTLVSGGKGTITIPGCGAVVVNAGQTGYFRTLYAPAQFAQLAQNYASLAPIDQIGLLADVSSLGWAGLQPATDQLDLAKAAPLSADPVLWSSIAGQLAGIHARYKGDPARQSRFDAFAVKRLAPVMEQIGWSARDGENSSVANLREQLISTLGDLGDAKVIAEARRRYAAMSSDPNAVPAALRKAVLAVVATHADAATWDALHASAKAEKNPLVRDRMYGLLAAPQDPALAQRALQLALTDEPGLTNSASMISEVAGEHPDMAFEFALANLDKINERVDASSRSRYIARLAYGSSDPAMVGKLNTYAGANLAATSRGDVELAIAAIKDRIKVNGARLPEIDAWLAKNGG